MTKHFTLLLFIGLAWGQSETDTSQIDYYQMGIDAAKENFKPKYSFALGAAMPNPIIYIIVNLLSPVKVEKKFISILDTKDGKSFKKGYVIETKKLRLKESVLGSCYTIVVVGTYLIIALNNSGGIG